MTVTKTGLKVLDGDVTCTVDSVESGVGYTYFGTNKGEVWRYNIPAATLTKLITINGSITSMALYSSTLYCGLLGGEYVSVTTS